MGSLLLAGIAASATTGCGCRGQPKECCQVLTLEASWGHQGVCVSVKTCFRGGLEQGMPRFRSNCLLRPATPGLPGFPRDLWFRLVPSIQDGFNQHRWQAQPGGEPFTEVSGSAPSLNDLTLSLSLPLCTVGLCCIACQEDSRVLGHSLFTVPD